VFVLVLHEVVAAVTAAEGGTSNPCSLGFLVIAVLRNDESMIMSFGCVASLGQVGCSLMLSERGSTRCAVVVDY